ncbi:MAG: BspA family leucine-rich repeat surface protein [Spirochaetia bacterium]
MNYTVSDYNGGTQNYTVTVRTPITRTELDQLIADGEDVTGVDTSEIRDMSELFKDYTSFNQNISSWDVSNVTDIREMFYYAAAFNQDITSWSDHIAETVQHTDFSAGTCPLETSYHPYTSWDN